LILLLLLLIVSFLNPPKNWSWELLKKREPQHDPETLF